MNDYVLVHYGVKGMRWGVSRAESRRARIERRAAKEGWSEDAKNAAIIKTKKVKQMTNSDLKKLNERLQLENQYRNIKSQHKNAGSKFVQDVLRESAKDTAKSYVTKYAKKGVETVIKKASKK